MIIPVKFGDTRPSGFVGGGILLKANIVDRHLTDGRTYGRLPS